MSANPDSLPRAEAKPGRATLEAILDSVLDGILTIDARGTILTFNAAAERMFGYTAPEIIGKNINLLMPDPNRQRLLSQFVNTGGAEIIGAERQLTANLKDGTELPVEVSVGYIADSDEPMFVGIVRDVSNKKRTEFELDVNYKMLANISSIQSNFILDGNPKTAFDGLLEKLLELTDSSYGFIGEIHRKDDGTPYLKTHAITNIAWNDETLKFYEENAPQGMEFLNLKSLFGEVITTGRPVIANDPYNDPRRAGLPPGHPALNAFLGLPFHIGDRMVGMAGIANRPNGYNDDLVRLLSPFMMTCGNLVGALESERQKINAEEALRDANNRLAATVAEIGDRNREITQLSELEELLQSCETREEAYSVVAHMSKKIFPDTDGALYGSAGDSGNLELMYSWGEETIEPVFSALSCVGIRRGRPHVSSGSASPLNCRHVNNDQYVCLCVPLIGKSESFGVLQLLQMQSETAGAVLAGMQELAVRVSRRIAIAFANLKLAASLRDQSLRDPLTNLFNRRYMVETLERELHRVRREGRSSVSLILIDIDNFKQVNDDYGHGAGDVVLVEVGKLLEQFSRKSDIACRMGGEEFTVILPDCSLRIGQKRAEDIRQTFGKLVCTHNDESLGNITLSAGVAAFPDCATDEEGLLQAADAAMYRAKAKGKDCVISAPRLKQTTAKRSVALPKK
jgi:diguanylate cyclase (GGDEF)-like protein/PAS domain S-box-containing protein